MDIGVSLPSHITGVTGDDVIRWARRAEELGFSTLAATDRLAYEDYEPIVTLSMAAAVTERIGLVTNIMVAPQRSAGVLAKQFATLNDASGGRLTVGMGVGDRNLDYEVAGAAMKGRFGRLDTIIDEMRAIWARENENGAVVGPRPALGQPPILLGGRTENALRRAARHGAGWTMALGTPERYASSMERLRGFWSEQGNAGQPRGTASLYYGLGDTAEKAVRDFILDYFAFAGPYANEVAAFTPVGDRAVHDALDSFAAVGADELIFLPTSTDIGQLELLAELVL